MFKIYSFVFLVSSESRHVLLQVVDVRILFNANYLLSLCRTDLFDNFRTVASSAHSTDSWASFGLFFLFFFNRLIYVTNVKYCLTLKRTLEKEVNEYIFMIYICEIMPLS